MKADPSFGQIVRERRIACDLTQAELVRFEREPSPIPTLSPTPDEIGRTDLSGRAVKGFQLRKKIGSGGFGVVYRASQASVEREVGGEIWPAIARVANQRG